MSGTWPGSERARSPTRPRAATQTGPPQTRSSTTYRASSARRRTSAAPALQHRTISPIPQFPDLDTEKPLDDNRISRGRQSTAVGEPLFKAELANRDDQIRTLGEENRQLAWELKRLEGSLKKTEAESQMFKQAAEEAGVKVSTLETNMNDMHLKLRRLSTKEEANGRTSNALPVPLPADLGFLSSTGGPAQVNLGTFGKDRKAIRYRANRSLEPEERQHNTVNQIT